MLEKCKFCEDGKKIKADFNDYHKNSNMVAFVATMGISDIHYAKTKLALQIDLQNAKITPDNHILPWEFTFDINFCPVCGKPLYSE